MCVTSVITFTVESGHRRGSGRPIGSTTLGFGVTFTAGQAFTESPVHGDVGQKSDVATDRPPNQMTNLVRGEETLHLILQTEKEYSLKTVYSKGERKSPLNTQRATRTLCDYSRIVADSSSLPLRLARRCI